MISNVKGCKELFTDVINQGLCTLCGACAGSCPYLVSYRGRIVQTDNCTRQEGQCYQYCPRTMTDMTDLNRYLFGTPYDDNELGTYQAIFIAKSTENSIKAKAQYGDTITTLFTLAMSEGLISSAILTKTNEDKIPVAFIARSVKEIQNGAGSNYMACPVLETYNSLPENSIDKLAIVGMPCQVMATAKMKNLPTQHRASSANIELVIGLFCTWALAPDSFHRMLKASLNLPSVTRFDIPPPPANRLDVYTKSGKLSMSLDQVREFTMSGCTYCSDLTSEFADISVGAVEGTEGWNTVIIRSKAGARLIETAKKKGKLEFRTLPAENLEHLKFAALNKKKRAVSEIVKKTGNKENLLYLGLPPEVTGKLLG